MILLQLVPGVLTCYELRFVRLDRGQILQGLSSYGIRKPGVLPVGTVCRDSFESLCPINTTTSCSTTIPSAILSEILWLAQGFEATRDDGR